MCLVWNVLNHFKKVYSRIVDKCKFFENNPCKLQCCWRFKQESHNRSYDWQADGMEVIVQQYDGQPFSATVPPKVTCTVTEAEPFFKGQSATPTSVDSYSLSHSLSGLHL